MKTLLLSLVFTPTFLGWLTWIFYRFYVIPTNSKLEYKKGSQVFLYTSLLCFLISAAVIPYKENDSYGMMMLGFFVLYAFGFIHYNFSYFLMLIANKKLPKHWHHKFSVLAWCVCLTLFVFLQLLY